MPTTSAGLPYPGPTDPLSQLDTQLSALAGAAIGDLTTLAPTMATGWTLTSARGRKLGTALAWLELVVVRATGAATLTASATGDVADTDICTLPAGWIPARAQYLNAIQGGASMWTCRLGVSGVVTVLTGAPTATIAAGQTLTTTGLVALS